MLCCDEDGPVVDDDAVCCSDPPADTGRKGGSPSGRPRTEPDTTAHHKITRAAADESTAPTSPARGLIRLTLAEIRRLVQPP